MPSFAISDALADQVRLHSFLFIAPLIATSEMSIEYMVVLMIESMTLVATIAALSVGIRI